MARAIAVLNAGSSSLKFSIILGHDGQLQPLFRGRVEGLFRAPRFHVCDREGATVSQTDWPEGTRLGHEGAIEHLFRWADEERKKLGGLRLDAAGHRVGHGGLKYAEPVRSDAGVLADLEQLIPLAPLHQPYNLAPIRALRERRPELPQVACFDTAFHRTQHHLPPRQGPPVRRAPGLGARGPDLPATECPAGGSARGCLRGGPADVGPPRHRPALDRVRTQGGPAGAGARLLAGRLPHRR